MGRESSRVEVEDVSDDRLLFGARELTEGRGSFWAKGCSFVAFSESTVINSKGPCSCAEASEFAGSKSFKGKEESTFVFT
jgi:hypothetical protein